MVVDNPVIDNVFLNKVNEPTRHPWLRKKTGKVFVAAGAHVSLKCYDLLIRAFSLLKDKS